MFRGITALNLDTKGRLAVPVRYRDQLKSGQLVVTIDTDENCLLLYPDHEWEVIERKIEALPSLNTHSRRLQRLLIGHATDIKPDAQCRILLPPLLREYAGLQSAVILLGQGKKFELWDAAHWEQRRQVWLQADKAQENTLIDPLQALSL